jgi:uncharacterized protein
VTTSVREIEASLSNQLLHLILMPTEACNFRCTYCYETFQLKRMQPEIVRGIKSLLSRRAPDLSHLSLAWFGGEPLLALDIMEDILLHVQGLRRRAPGMKLSSDITTNAYFLNRRTFERLLALGVTGYQISFDGPREWHDRKRVLADGSGTFDRIWNHLGAMQEVPDDFSVLVRIHVDAENHQAVPEFIDQFASAFGKDPRFKLFIRTLDRYGGPNDHCLPVLQGERGRAIVAGLRQYASDKGVAIFSTQGIAICYAAKPNSFLVRADGRLNKCTVALDDPGNTVGRLREDGRAEVDSALVNDWMRGFYSGDEESLRCPMKGFADRALRGLEAQPAPGA